MTNKRVVYVDGVDWQHEIGEAAGGNRVYAHPKDLLDNQKCAKHCGIVKVTSVEWVKPQDLDSDVGVSFHDMATTEYKHYEVSSATNRLIKAVTELSEDDWKSLDLPNDLWKDFLLTVRNNASMQKVELKGKNKYDERDT